MAQLNNINSNPPVPTPPEGFAPVPPPPTGFIPLITHGQISPEFSQGNQERVSEEPQDFIQPPSHPAYQGVHYSNNKFKTIEGNRRGLPDIETGQPAGKESARLQLGTELGHGENAPEGFYVYDSGKVNGDPAIRSRKNSYPVQGDFHFADIDTEPLWHMAIESGTKDASAHGAADEQAQGLGINKAENSLRNAGFDGYYSGSFHPEVKFIFGNYQAAAAGPQVKAESAPVAQKSIATSPSKPMSNSIPAPPPDPMTTHEGDPAGVNKVNK